MAVADEGPGSVHLRDLLDVSLDGRELEDAAGWVRGRFPSGPYRELDDILEILERRADG